MPRAKTEPAVLLVGVDDSTAHACAEAASPVKIVRAKRLATAIERVARVRPLAVVVGSEVAPEQIAKLLARVVKQRQA